MVLSLQSFLEEYEAGFPDEVLHIHQPISYRYQVTALVSYCERQRRFPVLVLHNVQLEDQNSPHPLVVFLLSSRLRIARILGCTPQHLGQELARRIAGSNILPQVVERQDAPVKDVLLTGSQIDLSKFPALIHHEMDPGPYLSAGFLTLQDPDTAIFNSALHRGWISGKAEIRPMMVAKSHNGHIFAKYEQRRQDVPAVYWIGHHPLAILGCQIRDSIERDHYQMMSSALGEGLRLVQSESLGKEFLVPADAEVVIEGYLSWEERKPEGPFGEYSRYSGPQKIGPVMKVTAVTHRHQAIWDDIVEGHSHWVGAVAKEAAAYEQIKKSIPTLVNVHLPISGCASFHIYLQIIKNMEGLGKTALIAALNSNIDFKHAFVFDEDVDIFDEKEVLMALATRFQGDRDLLMLPGCSGPALDPSGRNAVVTKMGFDCTKPYPSNQFPTKVHIPEALFEDIGRYIEPATLNKVPLEING